MAGTEDRRTKTPILKPCTCNKGAWKWDKYPTIICSACGGGQTLNLASKAITTDPILCTRMGPTSVVTADPNGHRCSKCNALVHPAQNRAALDGGARAVCHMCQMPEYAWYRLPRDHPLKQGIKKQ